MRVFVLLLLICAGCREYGPVLTEPGTVEDLLVTPESHGTGYVYGSGPVSTHVPTSYAVVFKCAHGRFIIQGADDEHERLWKKLEKGKRVTISFREVIKDGHAVDYDFIDAKVEVVQ